jgi:VanZ family protein
MVSYRQEIVIHAIVETNHQRRDKLVNSALQIKNTKPFFLARLMLILYLCLVAYASLTPFNFSIISHLKIWSWLLAPTPRYIPIFDVLSNVIGYLPFGFLMVVSLFPKFLKWQAFIITLFLGMAFSGVLESLQTYLPTRIPSLIDLYSNALGVLIGALFALPMSPQWLSGNQAERVRESIFGNQQGFFLLMILCPLAQIYPQNAWLGMGDLGMLETRISPYWTMPLDHASQEILITLLATFCIGTLFLLGIKKKASPMKLVAGLFIFMVGLKLIISQFQFGQIGASTWWGTSVFIGLVAGFLLIYLAQFLSKQKLRILSLLALLSLIVLVNVLPYNPYFHSLLEQLPQGKLTHINGLFAWISIIWPFLAIFVLLKTKNIDLR